MRLVLLFPAPFSAYVCYLSFGVVCNGTVIARDVVEFLVADEDSWNAPKFLGVNGIVSSTHIHDAGKCFSRKKQFLHDREIRHLSWSTQATGSGVEASFTEPNKNDISLRDVKTVVESRDDDKIQVRVDLTEEETQRTFDEVLTNLARTAPPIPGFRKMKGEILSHPCEGSMPHDLILDLVPKSFLLQMLGRDRVTKFVIQEIVSTTIRDYVTKENLKVGSKCNTIQTAEELESAFSPGRPSGSMPFWSSSQSLRHLKSDHPPYHFHILLH
ncbi:unnamed protein product [Spirodela intermedia]|uniref:peptidylprolyl isomerase n=1 Tax=Spirodela intermedia TaxID=51605 RepID=A0A7I8IT59_SPIIN|nr:unnamed protein product [Spirodela intermedia]CAA6660325.1 unnamed protein product [Spirodela intermedia]